MKVIAAIVGLVLVVAVAVAALKAYANSTDGSSKSGSSSPSLQDTGYLQAIQQYNLAEQAFGQIAQDRGQSAATANLAATTISDHKSAQSKVASLAKNLGVTLPTSPSFIQQSQADQLKSVDAASFDLDYAENQLAGHKESIAATQTEISKGTEPDVVSYAKSFLPVEQAHLSMAQSQVDALSGGTSSDNNTTGTGSTGGGGSPTAVPAGSGGLAARPLAQLNAALSSVTSAVPAAPHTKTGPSEGGAGTGPPMVLALPSIDVTAYVVPVGVSQRELQVPNNPTQVGWWVASAEAGASTGSVIIDGHVDTSDDGLGALYRVGIGDLRIGDRITVTTMFGRQVNYRIYAQSVYAKTAQLPAEVLASTREPRLVLITCGGPFDTDDRSYEDNVVVYARPSND
jgi:predicted outer membrane protein/sortase (surface protein transpeptidase)